MALRNQSSDKRSQERPLFIWEPVPDLCTEEELANCANALKYVDVVSPNHSELGAFFQTETNGKDHVDHRTIERLCRKWLQAGIGPTGQGAVVVRAGKDGCFLARPGQEKWMPAYHQSAEKVVDPTGGGNAFLGGLAIGLVKGGSSSGVQNLVEATIWATVAASFAIEQVGMPVLCQSPQGETWNGVLVKVRLLDFIQGLEKYVQP